MPHDSQRPTPPPRAGWRRRLTVGTAAFGGWLLFNLVLLALLPALLLVRALLGSAAISRLMRWALRRFFAGYLSAIRFLRIDEQPDWGALRAAAPCVVVANHISWLDGLLLLAHLPDSRLPITARYLKVPVVGMAARWLGCLPFDQGSPRTIVEGVARAEAVLEQGLPLVAFPEGTRVVGEPGRFADVFFRLAAKRGVPIVPLALHSDLPQLAPVAGSWLTARRPRWTIRALPAIEPDPRDRGADLARRVRKRIAQELVRIADEGKGEPG